ncbi:ABC transporter ATP-binding protein [Haematobacter genomosp. 1]|uniref:Fe3+/spermidine/putrescine ABC transporter ATP-binding protein n=1 Tax=Haematobacter genomosp. 1 TaxID=366618 RepID=A0A212AAI5_9RHOB|nr:ABC transporter ATP-binding protein [Haematobacter genomosp. 1]OWJ77149.1 Fe3+/spermidine/putrescine ABC transporter ATP-binding protein [Haematobacter genomosp. 1]
MSDVDGLHVRGVVKKFGDMVALRDVTFGLKRGELLTLLGPSGCGKTTLLRAIGGFVDIHAGNILVEGADIGALPPERRPTATVFQGYALFPHMTVAENVAYGLRLRRVPKADLTARVARALDSVQLSHLSDRMPSQLSGGQQQRVALARCFVIEPRVLLMDEPFSALDRNLREEMQVDLRKLQQRLGITTVVVTHDQEEAYILSDRVAIMKSGVLHQFDTPDGIYDRPATRFVADFTAMTNLLSGRLDGNMFHADGIGAFPAPQGIRPGDLLGLRPEALKLLPADDPRALVRGQVNFAVMTGANASVEVSFGDAATLKVVAPRLPAPPKAGDRVGIAISPRGRATRVPV